MAIESMPIIMLSPDGIDIGMAVDVAMSMPDIVLVGDIDVDILVILMSLIFVAMSIHVRLRSVDLRDGSYCLWNKPMS